MTTAKTYALTILAAAALALGLTACGDSSPDNQTPDATVQPDTGPAFVQFADPNLEQCVRDQLSRPAGDLLPTFVADLTYLECADQTVASLSGLEHAVNLKYLSLFENSISDLSPLAGLTQLTELQLGGNQIQDLTPLSGLTALQRLGLSQNDISDVSALGTLTALVWLNLDNNQIQDVSHLTALTNLKWLTLEYNNIVNRTPITALENIGVETYGREILPGPALSSLRDPSAAIGLPARLQGHLTVSPADAAGHVSLRWATTGGQHDVRTEFGGRLSLEGDRLHWETARGRLAVGWIDARGAHLCTDRYAERCALSVGVKGSWDGSRRPAGVKGVSEPVISAALSLTAAGRQLLGTPVPPPQPQNGEYFLTFDDISQWVYASPNQFDAGSCLFMANTGAMELLLNQQSPPEVMGYLGNTDLSERWLMNAGDYATVQDVPYHLTDTIYLYNVFGGSLLSRDYPFTVGYVKENATGNLVRTNATDPDAYLSCYVNWWDDLPSGWQQSLAPTPEVERTLLFVDPLRNENSQWNVGIIGPDVVERIKYELRTKNAPVIVVYNHYLYWHADIVVGYDDNIDNSDDPCPMVSDTISYFNQQGATSYVSKIQNHQNDNGGCATHGVFYVRDSIYDGTSEEEVYTYAPGVTERYSRRIITRTYNWVTYLGNHAYTVQRK